MPELAVPVLATDRGNDGVEAAAGRQGREVELDGFGKADFDDIAGIELTIGVAVALETDALDGVDDGVEADLLGGGVDRTQLSVGGDDLGRQLLESVVHPVPGGGRKADQLVGGDRARMDCDLRVEVADRAGDVGDSLDLADVDLGRESAVELDRIIAQHLVAGGRQGDVARGQSAAGLEGDAYDRRHRLAGLELEARPPAAGIAELVFPGRGEVEKQRADAHAHRVADGFAVDKKRDLPSRCGQRIRQALRKFDLVGIAATVAQGLPCPGDGCVVLVEQGGRQGVVPVQRGVWDDDAGVVASHDARRIRARNHGLYRGVERDAAIAFPEEIAGRRGRALYRGGIGQLADASRGLCCARGRDERDLFPAIDVGEVGIDLGGRRLAARQVDEIREVQGQVEGRLRRGAPCAAVGELRVGLGEAPEVAVDVTDLGDVVQVGDFPAREPEGVRGAGGRGGIARTVEGQELAAAIEKGDADARRD